LGVAVRVTDTAEGGRLTCCSPRSIRPPAPRLAAAPEGEGWVVFSARPWSAAAIGTAINAPARVCFDDNLYLDTNVHLNTLRALGGESLWVEIRCTLSIESQVHSDRHLDDPDMRGMRLCRRSAFGFWVRACYG
jgi:hypothetical protein